MNRSPSGLSVSKTLVGYFNTKASEGLSPRTLRNYEHRLQQCAEFVGDLDVTKVGPQDIRGYMVWLSYEVQPIQFNGDRSSLSPKILRNAYITLSPFFTWAAGEFNLKLPMQRVQAPK